MAAADMKWCMSSNMNGGDFFFPRILWRDDLVGLAAVIPYFDNPFEIEAFHLADPDSDPDPFFES